jgi:hypothetical protein
VAPGGRARVQNYRILRRSGVARGWADCCGTTTELLRDALRPVDPRTVCPRRIVVRPFGENEPLRAGDGAPSHFLVPRWPAALRATSGNRWPDRLIPPRRRSMCIARVLTFGVVDTLTASPCDWYSAVSWPNALYSDRLPFKTLRALSYRHCSLGRRFWIPTTGNR